MNERAVADQRTSVFVSVTCKSYVARSWGLSSMAWITPKYSKGRVDRAGKVLAGDRVSWEEYSEALEVLSNWRSSHSFPLNTFQNALRKMGRRVDAECLVAQRVKRLSSIAAKLDRYPGLRLSQMQDIGGCRIVVRDIDAVRQVADLYRKSGIKHVLARRDDYLAHPQASGYRGVHLIYRYFSDKNGHYNGLQIEIQIRSQFQHAWATAVETVGTFLRQSLKSSIGEAEWLRFFALMGTAIAFAEGTEPVPDTPADSATLVAELEEISARLDVMNRLQVYGSALDLFQAQGAEGEYFLLMLDPVKQSVSVRGYTRGQLAAAQAQYLELEKSVADTPADAVLVSVDSVAALQRAYPNYFLDTRVFMGLLRDTLERKPMVVEETSTLKPSSDRG
jgi:ppGpp synthetase/RelA/SpoT-type nucleotidyltranferase